MSKAIRVHKTGGPDSLHWEDVPSPEPGNDEAIVRIEAAGVNFIDVYHRTGSYPIEIPFTPGMEGAGVVASVGQGVTEVSPGDRVAYAMNIGSYQEFAAVPAWKLVVIPDGVSSSLASAIMLQGMTAHYLCHDTFPLKPGHLALVHAAAGGVGLLLVQMAKKLGARVFGTVSTEAKAEAAKRAGADVIIRYTDEDFEAVVKEYTRGEGVDVIYDSVGKSTYEKSLESLKPRGMLVLYGQSSGKVPPLDVSILAQKGSLFLTRPTLGNYAATRGELLDRARTLFQWMNDGELKVTIDRKLPMAKAAEAHQLLEGRQTTGKLVLITED